MAARDKIRLLPAMVPPATADGVRATTNGDNNKRTERYQLRVTANVTPVAALGTNRNKGSVLALLQELGFNDGGTDKVVMDARLARFIAEALAPSALPATRLDATSGVLQALEETVPIWLSAVGTGNPNETKYVEANKQLQQQVFITPNRLASRITNGAGGATIAALTANVEQVYDDLVGTPPWLTAYTRQVVQDITGANAAQKVDLRGSRYIRGLGIQQDTNPVGEVADIINGLVMRGDADTYIGQNAIPFRDLVLGNAVEQGGAISSAPAGYLWIDFCRYGRLSTMWNPYQDTNMRLELNVQPSVAAGATSSQVRVAIVEYESTSVTLSQLPIEI